MRLSMCLFTHVYRVKALRRFRFDSFSFVRDGRCALSTRVEVMLCLEFFLFIVHCFASLIYRLTRRYIFYTHTHTHPRIKGREIMRGEMWPKQASSSSSSSQYTEWNSCRFSFSVADVPVNNTPHITDVVVVHSSNSTIKRNNNNISISAAESRAE
jgi:hypothetical protein